MQIKQTSKKPRKTRLFWWLAIRKRGSVFSTLYRERRPFIWD